MWGLTIIIWIGVILATAFFLQLFAVNKQRKRIESLAAQGMTISIDEVLSDSQVIRLIETSIGPFGREIWASYDNDEPVYDYKHRIILNARLVMGEQSIRLLRKRLKPLEHLLEYWGWFRRYS